jgi:hypothetical protein
MKLPTSKFADSQGRQYTSARVKVNRAWNHLQVLDERVAVFRQANADAFTVEHDPKSGKDVYSRGQIGPLPTEIALIFGDLITNLRSALDHIVYALWVKHHGTDPESRSEFPIFLFPRNVTVDGRSRLGFDPKGISLIEPLPPEAKDFIEAQQPYHGTPPESHDLWLLQTLVNIDKHRAIPLITPMSESPGVEVAVTEGIEGGGPAIEWHGPAMREGDPILSLPRPDDTYRHFQPELSVDVFVFVPGMKPVRVTEAATHLHKRIRWTVGKLEAFL